MAKSNDNETSVSKDDDRHNEWQSKFPKLEDLSAVMPTSAYCEWFVELPNKIFSSTISREYYKQLESELAALSEDAWSDFKSKLLTQVKSTRRELVSLFNEAAGYAHLKAVLLERHQPYDAIRQPDVSGTKAKKSKEPEWVALHREQVVAALEVKTAFESDDQVDYIESNTQKLKSDNLPKVRRLSPSISEGLLKKLNSHVDKAKEQLRAVQSQPDILVVYVIVNVDYETAQSPTCTSKLQAHLDGLNEDGILVVGDLRSPCL